MSENNTSQEVNITETQERILKIVKRTIQGVSSLLDRTKPDAYINKEIYQISDNHSFVKAKANAFGIEKLQLSFVEFDADNKSKGNIDIFLSFGEALALSNDIISGKLYRLMEQEKAKGEKYPAASYNSPLGGINEQKCKERNLRTDGKAISRTFSIGAGSKADAIFTAVQRPGTSAENGLIVPDKVKPDITIRVPCSFKMLKEFALMINANIQAFLSSQYSRNAYMLNSDEKKKG